MRNFRSSRRVARPRRATMDEHVWGMVDKAKRGSRC